MKKNIRFALRFAAAITTLAASGIAFAAAPAHASNVVINGWTQIQCGNEGYYLCLWYHPGAYTGGAGWGTKTSVPTISGDFELGTVGVTSGMGQPVRNDAGSMSNASPDCIDFAYVSPNYVGNSNEVDPNDGGNLTNSNQQSPPLHNNEASVAIVC